MFCDPFSSKNISVKRSSEVLEVIKSLGFVGQPFYGSGYSSADVQTPYIVQEVFQEFIESEVSNLYGHKFYLKKIWVNVNPPGAYQSRHTHSEFVAAGTYYLCVPENSGNLIFYHPSPYVEALQRLKPYYPFTHTHVPSDNDFLIWPGYLSHEVTYNYSEQTRITVSFCLDP